MIPFISSEDFPALGEDSGRVNPGVSTVNGKELGASSENPKIGRWRKLFGEERNIESYSSCKLPYLKPQCIDGKLISVISPEDLVDELKVCDKFLVGYFVGRKLPFHIVKEAMEKAWNLKDGFRLTLHEESMYIFEFDRDEDRIAAMELGSVTIASTLFLIRPWKLFIEQDILEMKSVPVWMDLRNVPTHLWNAKGLGMIASVVGIPLFSDLHTLNRTRMRYARVCVEMEANSEFPDFIPVVYDGKEFKVSVEYAWKPPRCLSCVTFGHSNFKCPKVGKKVWIPKMNKTITRGKGLGEGAQGIIKEAAIVVGTVAPNGNNEVGMATDFVEENLASHLQRNEVIEVTITNSDEGNVTGTQSNANELQMQSHIASGKVPGDRNLELGEKNNEKLWTYSRNKTAAKKSTPKPAEICYLNPFEVLYEEGELLDIGLMRGRTSVNEEDIDSEPIVSQIDTRSASMSDEDMVDEATVEPCTNEESNALRGEPSHDSLDETEVAAEKTVRKVKTLEEVSRYKPMSKDQNMDRLMKFGSSLNLFRGGKEAEVNKVFGDIVGVNKPSRKANELGPSNNDLGRGKRTPMPKKKH